MSPRIYTAGEAAALLAAAEAGPYTADSEDGIIWPVRETALDPIGAVSLRLNEAQSAANGALLAASCDLATSVVHHAERAERAERAEAERDAARAEAARLTDKRDTEPLQRGSLVHIVAGPWKGFDGTVVSRRYWTRTPPSGW